MLDLFRVETETQAQVLTAGLLELERDPTLADRLEACMRAAHSLKGAARIIGLAVGVDVAHAMEDCFVAAQRGRITLKPGQTDVLLQGVDVLTRIAKTPEPQIVCWSTDKKPEVDALRAALLGIVEGKEAEPSAPAPVAVVERAPAPVPIAPETDRVLRVTADNLNRLLGLTGESMVESRWLKPFAESLLRLKRLQYDTARSLESLRGALSEVTVPEAAQTALSQAQHRLHECRQLLSQRLVDLEMYDSRSTNLAHRLYDEALSCRMRPFADGVQGFPRMVRDVGRALDKPVRLEIVGKATPVDRDILEKLDAPLGHLLRNAVDHGIESAEQRSAAGKPAEGVIRLEARHSAGMLLISISDDGAGVDLERLRRVIVERGLTNVDTAARLHEAELLEFLFLPGFTTKGAVTDISGRGVGLDVVKDMLKQVRGTVRVQTQAGQGTRFVLQLPLTLSVVRTLLVDIGGEPYALPLAYIVHTLRLPRDRIELLQGRQHFRFGDRQVGLVAARQLFGGDVTATGDDACVIVVADHERTYGLVVDRFLGERELVVQPLDPRLGRVANIAAGALMEDGAPTLIIDVEDLVRSIDRLVAHGDLSGLHRNAITVERKARKRVLVVDDSLTVRDLERKLLDHHGYEVDVAMDGIEGWNAVRAAAFDLVITDVDMPRMDGIELVSLIRRDANLKSLPVMIVSYKDREEDRRRGLEAGADYYLTKGSFHDDTLVHAVADLIGEAA